VTVARTDLWRPLDADGTGDNLPRETVLVWLWWPVDGLLGGYWVLGQRLGGRWCLQGGSPITWAPTRWEPITEPPGAPPGEESGT
jgi:hypothetical protein